MDEKPRILLIEDEVSICDILSFALKKEGYEVKFTETGKKGISIVEVFKPDLIILDLMLPDISGFDVCRTIVSRYKTPIIMLTARNDIVDKILGLELGADDYITKPFDVREVIARVRIALRRVEMLKVISEKIEDDIVINGLVTVNKKSRTVMQNGCIVRLKPKEYDLLLVFAENKERVFTRELLLDQVWSMDYEGELRTVDVHNYIFYKRRKPLSIYNCRQQYRHILGCGKIPGSCTASRKQQGCHKNQ